MHRLLLAVPFVFAASAAFGAGWESGMVEDEGGPVMQAWVSGTGGDMPPELRMMCGDQLNLRFAPAGGAAEPASYDEPTGFTFDFGEDSVSMDMQYEEMDGAYAAYFDPDAPIVGMLRTADKVAVDAPSGPWAVEEFTLEGSSKAIAAVLKSCN